MPRLFIYGALALVFAQTQAFADTDETGMPLEGQSTIHLEAALPHTHWDFITCVHTAHECYHEAQEHRYEHYRAVHDRRTCRGHEHLACYGGHH